MGNNNNNNTNNNNNNKVTTTRKDEKETQKKERKKKKKKKKKDEDNKNKSKIYFSTKITDPFLRLTARAAQLPTLSSSHTLSPYGRLCRGPPCSLVTCSACSIPKYKPPSWNGSKRSIWWTTDERVPC